MTHNGYNQDVAVGNEIILGGIAFPTTGPVRVANITVVPNPIVLGDTSRQTETQVVSQFIQPDASAGLGVNRANARIEFDRAWTSEAETRYTRQITLPPVVTDLGAPAGETAAPFWIGQYLGTIYAIFGQKVYTLSGTTWTLEHTLVAAPTDVLVYNDRLWISHLTAGLSWKESPEPVGGIGTTPGSWQVVPENSGTILISIGDQFFRWTRYGGAGLNPTVPYWLLRSEEYPYIPDIMGGGGVPTPWATNFMMSQNVDIFEILVTGDTLRYYYFVGTDGVYLGPGSMGLFKSRIAYQPLTPGNYGRRAACVFGNDIVIPTGELGLIAARIGTLEPRAIGLDQEDGLPGDRWGVVDALVPGTQNLYALVTHRGINDTGARDISVYAYDGHWHYVAGLASGLMTMVGTAVQGHCMALGSDGLYVGHTRADGTPAIKRIDERIRSINPKQIGVDPSQTRFNYSEGPVSHITPWYDFGSEVQSKLLLKLQVQCEATATETIEIFYALDLDEASWTPMAVLNSNGLHVVPFNGPYGRQARLVRFKYILRREAGAANDYKRPLIDFSVVEYMRLLPATYGFAIELDLTKGYKGRTAVDLLDALKRLSDPVRTPELIAVSYQDDQHREPQTHFCRISRMTGQEYSGRANRGTSSYMVSLMAPYAQDSI